MEVYQTVLRVNHGGRNSANPHHCNLSRHLSGGFSISERGEGGVAPGQGALFGQEERYFRSVQPIGEDKSHRRRTDTHMGKRVKRRFRATPKKFQRASGLDRGGDTRLDREGVSLCPWMRLCVTSDISAPFCRAEKVRNCRAHQKYSCSLEWNSKGPTKLDRAIPFYCSLGDSVELSPLMWF